MPRSLSRWAALVALASLVAVPAAHGRSTVSLRPCDDPPQTFCGSIDVPLDRAHPGRGTTPIFFALVRHSDPGRAAGTILANEGGPGFSSTAATEFYADLFGPLLDRRDLLTIDLRGTGRSAAIDCPALQQGIGDFDGAVRACGEQLGASSSLFGAADRSDDIDDVRAALGIARFDFYGLSAGGVQAQSYAARYPKRVRTVVLDAPGSVGADAAFQSPAAGSLVRGVELVCERSPSCRAVDGNPRGTLRDLLARVRSRPVEGTALDADGQPHHVVVDEAGVIDLLADDSAGFLDASEIGAAARALARGDEAPLLRMAAETDFPRFSDSGDPRFFSAGDFDATFCTDSVFPFDKSAPEATRRAQYDAAVAGLRPNAFAPFSVPGWLGSVVPVGEECVPWPAQSGVRPPVPPGARFPAAPALALTGDMDSVVPSEIVSAVAAQFPRAQLVTVAKAGHAGVTRSGCARELIVRFIATAARVDASCASQFTPTYAVRDFPGRAADAAVPPADPDGEDASRRLDRRVAAMAWATAYDAIQRSFRMSGGSGVGLRAGTFTVDFGDAGEDFAYDGVRFAGDVAASGSAHWDFDSGGIVADLRVDGPGGQDGALHVEGRLFPHTAPLPASGVIGGRSVAVLVPTA
jgi:pimeloyl-ACP methyl ester carboxylesterase